MRVLLTVPPSAARLHSVAPLGWALRTAGHQAQVVAEPAFTDTVTRTGLVAVAAADAAELAAYASLWRPDVIMWDAGSDAGATVARSVGAVGVRLLGARSGTPAGASADVTLDALPPSLRPAGEHNNVSVRPVVFGGGAVLPSWLRRPPRKRRVLVSCGRLPGAAVAALFDAIAGTSAEHVCEVADGWSPPAGTRLPPGVRLFESAPRDAVLASCAAVVHDGDPELTLAAAAAGVPQLVLTAAGCALAARVADEGAALVVDPAAVTTAALDRLRDDADLEKGAARLREDVLAMPGPRDVVPTIVALTGTR